MKKEYKSDLEKLRDYIDIHRVSAVQRQINDSSNLDEFPIKKPKKAIKIIGSGEHTIFVFDSMPTIKEIDKKIDRIVSDSTCSKIKRKALDLTKKQK